MADRKELFKQAKHYELEGYSSMSNDAIEEAIIARMDEVNKGTYLLKETPGPEEKESERELSLDDQLAKLSEETNDILTRNTVKIKKIKKTPEYKQALIARLKLINGQLKGHSIGPDVRANLRYELSIIEAGSWKPGKIYRRKRKADPFDKSVFKPISSEGMSLEA